MKRRISYLFLCSAALALIGCSAQPPRRPAGSFVSGGGNGQIAEFHRLVRLFHFAAVKSRLDLGLAKPLPLEAFNVLMLRMRIEATSEPLRLRGVAVEAINYPALGKVRFHGDAWKGKSALDKYRLAVHEVLGLLGYDDTGYLNSDKIAARSRHILSTVGVSFDGPGKNDEILYTAEAGDPIVCRAHREGNWNSHLVEFLLQPGGGVASEKVRVEGEIWLDFSVSYDNEQQVHLRLARNRNPVGGGTGQGIADLTIDYHGRFRRLETHAGGYTVSCGLSSEI